MQNSGPWHAWKVRSECRFGSYYQMIYSRNKSRNKTDWGQEAPVQECEERNLQNKIIKNWLVERHEVGWKSAVFWKPRSGFQAAAAAKLLQSCLTLCDPIDGSPPGSPVPGILQARARTLEWVAISFSNAWKWKVKVKSLSRVWLLVTPCTAAYQAPPSMGFSRQEYWNGLPLPSGRSHNCGMAGKCV